MTCEHVILEDKCEYGLEEIDLYYHLETVKLTIRLDQRERFIKSYIHDYNVDITIIEIKKNEVPYQYFLEPDYNVIGNYNQYSKKKIIIHQFPIGREQCFSEGNILYVKEKKREMFYDVSTEPCSSGSPVIDKETKLVIGVHKEGEEDINIGTFLDVVLTDNERGSNNNYIRDNIKTINPRNYTR